MASKIREFGFLPSDVFLSKETINSIFVIISVFMCIRLRVSVLEAFDPLLINDSSEAFDQGNFIKRFPKSNL